MDSKRSTRKGCFAVTHRSETTVYLACVPVLVCMIDSYATRAFVHHYQLNALEISLAWDNNHITPHPSTPHTNQPRFALAVIRKSYDHENTQYGFSICLRPQNHGSLITCFHHCLYQRPRFKNILARNQALPDC